MFSDHVQKIDRTSGRTLFLIAGALVILCQLVAMGIVADGQVQKAAARDSHLSSQRLALAQCFENNFGAERGSCVRQVYNDDKNSDNGSTLSAARPADDKLMAYDSGAVRSPVKGVMAVSFASN